MKPIHLFYGTLSEVEKQVIGAIAQGKLPEEWQEIITGSNAIVFTNHYYFLKLFTSEGLGQKIKTIFKIRSFRSPGIGSLVFQKEKKMAALGFHTATVTAHGKVGLRHFLITRRISGLTLREALLQSKGPEKFSLTRELAEEVARMHNAGIFHGDLNVYNVIVVRKSTERAQFYFLDNEQNKFYRKIPNRKARKNLSQLNYLILPNVVNKTDRLRFLVHYLKDRSIPDRKRQWWMDIQHLFEHRKRRKTNQ